MSVSADGARFSGHRIGIGVASTMETWEDEIYYSDTGLHLEYAYDANRILSFRLSRDATGDEFTQNITLDTRTWKAGLEIGYAVSFKGWQIRPYSSIGAQYSKGHYSILQFDGEVTQTSPYYDFGVRAELEQGIYFDIKVDTFELKNEHLGDIIQSAFTIGYKF
ncbi:hypothetical protein VIN01S_23030 [Vibrio inusitatus NBRC 102082]|uniref:Outer membrane protein beta-barrel domain-containing protein n=2 Tax=Vibrio inusitatus TaxID=413402 RepID=A0A4Y3HWE0_9VIBR|nr:hypothetical protein VIN01S_23030 [Vibrio inusitatus NBRC 102082]